MKIESREPVSGLDPLQPKEMHSGEDFYMADLLTPEEFDAILASHELTPQFLSGLLGQRDRFQEVLSSIN